MRIVSLPSYRTGQSFIVLIVRSKDVVCIYPKISKCACFSFEYWPYYPSQRWLLCRRMVCEMSYFSALVCEARYFSHCVCIGARVYLDMCIVWEYRIASLLPTAVPIICPRSYLLFLDEQYCCHYLKRKKHFRSLSRWDSLRPHSPLSNGYSIVPVVCLLVFFLSRKLLPILPGVDLTIVYNVQARERVRRGSLYWRVLWRTRRVKMPRYFTLLPLFSHFLAPLQICH